MRMADDKNRATEAPVGNYPERPYTEAKVSPEDLTKVEDRQPDQIADYHKTHPTLRRTKAESKAVEQVQEQMQDYAPEE